MIYVEDGTIRHNKGLWTNIYILNNTIGASIADQIFGRSNVKEKSALHSSTTAAFPSIRKHTLFPHWKWCINKQPREWSDAYWESTRQNWFIYKPESHISHVHYVMYRRTSFGAFSAYIHHPLGWKYPILNSVSFRIGIWPKERGRTENQPWADYGIL